MQTKTVFASKTVIINTLVLIGSFYPPVGTWVAANPNETLQILSVAALALRFITKGKITLFGS